MTGIKRTREREGETGREKKKDKKKGQEKKEKKEKKKALKRWRLKSSYKNKLDFRRDSIPLP